MFLTNFKTKAYRSAEYLAFIKAKSCLVCKAWPVIPHHEGFGSQGMALKCPDSQVLPLCLGCHSKRHQVGQETFWHTFDVRLEMIKLLTEYLQSKGM